MKVFTSTKFVTNGIRDNIPSFMQNILWYMIETMQVEVKDYLQVFELGSILVAGKLKQMIVHTQEQPEYRKEYDLFTKQIVSGKIYVIDDKTHCTMLLTEEY